MSSKKCVIFAGGDPVSGSAVSKDIIEGAFIIAADRGLLLCKDLGLGPDMVIGDFDSLGHEPEGDNVITYPVEKDDTDLMLAIKQVRSQGFDEYYIFGALGGRLDHTLGNLSCLALLAEYGSRGFIISDTERVSVMMPGTYVFRRNDGATLSLFAFGSDIEGLALEGTKYEAEDARLSCASTLGVSNEINAPEAVLSFKKGMLLSVQTRYEKEPFLVN